MAIVFKYKNQCSLSYAPGFATPGNDGNVGKQGISGNTLYFIDYDLDNSYSIQLALQRIENNQILSSVASKTIKDRPYKENDLLLSKSGKMYKIKAATVTSAQNYKFDIEYIGSMHENNSTAISKAIIYDITGTRINKLDVKTGDTLSYDYNAISNSPIYTNRSNKLISEEITEDDKQMNGIWLKVFLAVDALYSNEQGKVLYDEMCDNLLKNYSFHLTVYLNNKKSLQGNSVPVDRDKFPWDPSPEELYQKLNFYKKIEFTNLIVIPVRASESSNFNILASKEIEVAYRNNIENQYDKNKLLNAVYLSDYAMDKLHPSGNNIKFTGTEDKTIWYKSGLGTADSSIDIDENGEIYVYPYLEEGATPTDNDIKYTRTELTNLKFYKSGISNDQASDDIDLDIFPNYSLGQSLTTNSLDEAQDALDNFETNDSEIIQVSQRYNNGWERNLRAGDSVYFSSNAADNVHSQMFNFINNAADNRYILTIKNKNTKEITTVELPVEFRKLI